MNVQSLGFLQPNPCALSNASSISLGWTFYQHYFKHSLWEILHLWGELQSNLAAFLNQDFCSLLSYKARLSPNLFPCKQSLTFCYPSPNMLFHPLSHQFKLIVAMHIWDGVTFNSSWIYVRLQNIENMRCVLIFIALCRTPKVGCCWLVEYVRNSLEYFYNSFLKVCFWDSLWLKYGWMIKYLNCISIKCS